LHWPTLAAAAAQGITLVIYMGISSIESLQGGLLEGLPATTPVAVIQHASLPTQRHLRVALGELVAAVHREAISSPAVIVVGDVVRAAQALDLGVRESLAA
ncbi:partial Uroporphyrinogen-III C-methyltransferase, partial [Burkholderiaceae bacterium]